MLWPTFANFTCPQILANNVNCSPWRIFQWRQTIFMLYSKHISTNEYKFYHSKYDAVGVRWKVRKTTEKLICLFSDLHSGQK